MRGFRLKDAMAEPSPTGNGGNEWLKPVDPNEGERKWAQYVAATTPPRTLHALPASGLATPQYTPQRLECPPPAAIDSVLFSAPLPVSSATPPKSPEPCSSVPPSSAQPQLFAQVDGKFVPVVVRSDGSVSHRAGDVESLSPAGKRPQPVSYPAMIPPAGVFESQNAWILLHQQQQLLFQLQQQQAVTAAALAGIAAKAVSPAADISWFVPQQLPKAPTESDLVQQAVCQPSEAGLSTPHSSAVTPTVDSTKGGVGVASVNGGRNARQEALLQQLRQTTITLPPPPPPPAPEKPFLFKRKSKSQSLEALMNSLQYTDLLTPSYSNKEQTQSETGVVVESLEDSSPMDADTPQLGSTATPSALPLAPGYKKKPCRAFQSAGGCRHGEKCLFSHPTQ